MKKITLSVAALALALNSYSQQLFDTTCTMVTKKEILEWCYDTDYLLDSLLHKGEYTMQVPENEVKCLHLFDDKWWSIRKVTIIYPDGEVWQDVLNASDHVYYTDPGPLKLIVGPSRFIVKL